MNYRVDPGHFRDLLRLLDELHQLHERLAELGQAKLEAIKRADRPAMQERHVEEQEVARRIQEREGLRRQMMDQVGESLGLPPRAARALPLSQLATRVAEPQRSALREAGVKLRAAVARVARINRVVGATTRGVLGHLERVLASVGEANTPRTGYRDDGTAVTGTSTTIFETLG